MSYKVTLEVYVNEHVTFPSIKVETQAFHFPSEVPHPQSMPKAADAEALEGVLTRTREFAETLTRGVLEGV